LRYRTALGTIQSPEKQYGARIRGIKRRIERSTDQAPTDSLQMTNFIMRFLAAAGLSVAAAVSAQQATPPLEISPQAPERYVVVKGDTLWDISGRFLEKPWRWPEIWDLNRESIRDPHWIYPGDVVLLDRSGAEPRLRLARRIGTGTNADGAAGAGGSGGTVRMQPMVRVEPLERDAVTTLDVAAIAPFLNRPLIIEENDLATNPRIVATQEGRVYLGRGDLAYVRGIEDEEHAEWHIYRKAKPVLDPDTRKPIAYEALFVGGAQLERVGDPATLRLTSVTEEVGVGDRLMPAVKGGPLNFVPRAPETGIDGRIVNVYRGVTQVGRNSVVAINRGLAAGIDEGHVLEIRLRGRTVVDREQNNEKIKLPDERVGHLMVFRSFENIAYGLVMEASQPISVGDVVANP